MHATYLKSKERHHEKGVNPADRARGNTNDENKRNHKKKKVLNGVEAAGNSDRFSRRAPGAYRVRGMNARSGATATNEELSRNNRRRRDSSWWRDESASANSTSSELFPVTTARVVVDEDSRRLSDIEQALRQLQMERENAAVAQVVAGSTQEAENIMVGHGERSRTGKRRCLWMVGAVIVLLLSIGAAVAAILLIRSDQDVPTIDDDQTSLRDLIASMSPDGGEALEDVQSPQYRALEWLQNDKELAKYSDGRKIQRYSLATLYYSTRGSQWTNGDNWLEGSHECYWWIQCEHPTTKVVCDNGVDVSRLCLPENNLEGILPPELSLLTSLVKLDLPRNKLSSTIPQELSRLTNLEFLSLSENDLSGEMSSLIEPLTNLEILHLFGGRLSGTIPTTIGLLSDLDELLLQVNRFTGTIPSEIGLLSKLDDLRLQANRLTGTIPDSIALLPLTFLGLWSNSLHGPFTCPDHIEYCDVSCTTTDVGAEPNSACRVLVGRQQEEQR